MLVLSRKVGEKIQIGKNISVVVVSLEGGRCKLGIEAPSDVRILREELIDLHANTPEGIVAENQSVLDFADPQESDTMALSTTAETVDANNLNEILGQEATSEETMDLDDINNLVGQFPDSDPLKLRSPNGGFGESNALSRQATSSSPKDVSSPK